MFRDIVTSAVEGAQGLPVTIKMRIGIDDKTMLDAGRIAQDAGVAWVALHARTWPTSTAPPVSSRRR